MRVDSGIYELISIDWKTGKILDLHVATNKKAKERTELSNHRTKGANWQNCFGFIAVETKKWVKCGKCNEIRFTFYSIITIVIIVIALLNVMTKWRHSFASSGVVVCNSPFLCSHCDSACVVLTSNKQFDWRKLFSIVHCRKCLRSNIGAMHNNNEGEKQKFHIRQFGTIRILNSSLLIIAGKLIAIQL